MILPVSPTQLAGVLSSDIRTLSDRQKRHREKEIFKCNFLSRASQIVTVCRLFQQGLLPQKDWEEFQEWDRKYCGELGTNNWPRWEEFGVDPKYKARPTPERPKKKPIGQGLRMAVFERDGFKCVKCGAQKKLTADHIIPEIKGGEATLENLQTLCRPCNIKKGART